ncbi:S-layer homology domain-containing protein [Romboutsia lituseburensis]|uniref:S-layer homology domain-containing protein n=1 Tax=Romboutsia lituseburensis TaxID=1537 RepID=UPI00215B69F0|nr:S-layer homology domain-containing protein [Romboutsia lituseburensis]MCR8745436.1 S-layer homology domain-containing protein [Romboutsia lituseburensis]
MRLKIKKSMVLVLALLITICTSNVIRVEAASQDYNFTNKLEDSQKVNLQRGALLLDVSLRGEIEVYNPNNEHVYTLTSNSVQDNKSKIILNINQQGQWYFKIKENYPQGHTYYEPWEIYYTQNITPIEDEMFEASGNNDDVIVFNSKKNQTLNINIIFKDNKGSEEESAVINLINKDGELSKELLYLEGDKTTQRVKVDVKEGMNIIEVYMTNRNVEWSMQVQPSYPDVDNHWAETQIRDFVNKGYTNGYEDGTFKPDGSITRAEFVSIFNRVFAITGGSGKVFNDTQNHWAKENIDIAVTNGICKGKSDEEFNPDDKITREEAAVMVANYKKISDSDYDKIKQYTDYDQVSEWAQTSLEAVVENGYISGKTPTTLEPKSSMTRAEAVVILSRIK